MSKVLKDPNKAAHEIIEVLEDGDAVRNDGEVLQAANKNPWYVLATIYGEQEEEEEPWLYDKMLAKQNRRVWNGWMCGNLEPKANSFYSESTPRGTYNPDTITRKELEKIEKRFQDRMGKGAKLPNPSGVIDLTELYFSKPFDFSHLIVPKNIGFWKTTFAKGVSFEASHFKEGANFQSAIFNYGPNFNKACFDSVVGFNSVCFGGFTDFEAVDFKHHADFGSATFVGRCVFRTVFERGVDFSNVCFEQGCDFNSVKFKSTTRFKNARFLTHVPEFHAAELYDDTVFTLPDNYRKNWPPLTDKDGMTAPDQKRAYNRLRLFMNKSLQIDEEQFFHRMEMRCKAVMAKWYHKPLYWLFAAFSDYGNSVWRPIAWGALSVVTAALFMLWWQGVFAFTPQNDAGFDWAFGLLNDGDIWAKPRAAFGWSISNALPFIGTGSLYYGGEFAAELAWPLRVVGGVQTLFGFVLLFLFGLGLRNRFRLR